MNKSNKIIIIILTAIIIAVICVGAYFLFNELNKANNKIDELEKENSTMKEILNKSNVEENNNSNNSSEISELEALELAEEKYMQASKYYWGNVDYDFNDSTELYMKVLNIEEVKDFFSVKGFKQYMEKNEYVVEEDGEYYRIAADRGGDTSYLGNELMVVSIDKNKIILNSIEKYAENEEDYFSEENLVTDIKKEVNKFILVKEDDEWKVEQFTLAN